MPTVTNRGVDLHYEVDGAGDAVVFVPDLGCGAWCWAWQAPALAGGFETVVWDPPGHGRSGDASDYSVAATAGHLEAVLSEAGVGSATVVGAGFGGAVALEYARRYSRAEGLVLLGTPAAGSRFDPEPFLAGPGEFEGLLSAGFREAYPGEVERIAEWRREEDAAEEVKRAQVRSLEGFDASEWLHEVTDPALVVHGNEDEVVPPEAGEALADGLPRGEFDAFAGDPHFVFVEQARLVTDRIVGFLEG